MDVKNVWDIYNTLLGVQCEEFCVPGVENLFTENSICDCAYNEMLEAYARLRERLGVADEDQDVEIIIHSLTTIEQNVSMKMFEYGTKFAVSITSSSLSDT